MSREPNREVAGFLWTRMGTTTQFISLLTLLPALSVLAKREAGCYQFSCGDDEDDCEDEGGREHGLWYCADDGEECVGSDECKVRARARARARPRRVCVTPCVWVASGVRAVPDVNHFGGRDSLRSRLRGFDAHLRRHRGLHVQTVGAR